MRPRKASKRSKLKLIESEKARIVSFSKRKNTLFQQANNLANSSVIPLDKRMDEQKLKLKLRVEKSIKETRGAIFPKHLKFDLNVLPEPEEEENH
ncbi:hypothetical protein H5410_062184 [Solanum commersonii]|uniref:MADS-box domain-containing protein n=1 Tax=Solanum commersonii TaxID=4109 RepID=A0A9J5WA59_SOLCO|nr:hypothetical protein H5410_062184 [Solanum commersonii]